MGQLEEYYAKYGQDQFGNKLAPAANTSGLGQGNVSTSFNPAKYSYSQYDANKNPMGPGTLVSGPSQTSTYSGPGGQWSSTGGGGWTNAQGQNVSDLGGYLKKGSLQASGADFSDYQNQLKGLLSDPSKIQQTAGYQFDVDQGNQAINRSAAAKGMSNSGGVLAELQKYGQGMASKEYGSQINRLQDLMRGSQQFGISSGYYDQLNPQKQQQGGGGMRTGSMTSPGGMQFDPRGI